jgi:hypothetical protein
MGGVGSGRQLYDRQFDSKSTTGESLPLDVRTMHRAGYLKAGARSTCRWWRGGDTPEEKARGASIGTLCTGDEVILLYSHRGEPVRQTVPLDWTACNYGGRRPWWRCPHCRRRVAVLYGPGKFFACRHCYRLCYESQKENPGDRALRAAWKIRQRLGQEDGGHMIPLPEKPKGMHWDTYLDLEERCAEHEIRSWAAVGVWLTRLENER